jgi:eukaryotic-like serine/threonine-protein kinase
VDRVGPGSVLAGRYHVQERIHQATWSSTWQAVDETLERPVSVHIVDAGHPRASDVVDAARRAAGVEDPRLQRVLDVGVEDGLTYVVSEWVGADRLSDLLRSGPLPPDEVRRLVGEAATALEAARHRGLHHLALTPDNLLRGHDGPVTVTGLAVDAALAGIEVSDPAAASRLDARALVALIYAGLTARWPLDPVPGLEPPPRVGSALPAPSELAAGVPADLDTVCEETLRDKNGPADPGQLATQLAPWAAGPVAGPKRAAGSFPVYLGNDSAATTVMPAVGTPSVQAAVGAPAPPPPPPPPVRPPSTHVPPQAPGPVEGPEPVQPRLAQGAQDPATSPPGFAPPMLPPQSEPVAFEPVAPQPPVLEPVVHDPAVHDPAVHDPAVHDPAVVAPAAVDPERSVELATTAATYRPPAAESAAPLLPPTPTARPPAAQTRAVLGVMLGFVLVLCLLAYCGLRSFGSHDNSDSGGTSSHASTTKPSTTPSTSPSGSPSSSSGAATTPASGVRLKIQSGKGFDPQGDGTENDGQAQLAFDKKASTGWTSDTYRSAAWGGLKKGVGIRLDLGSPQTVHTATVTIGGTGATVELRAVAGSSLTGSTVLAQKSHASGTFTFTVDSPVSSRYYVIWFTKPGQFSGGYRAEVDDVTLR